MPQESHNSLQDRKGYLTEGAKSREKTININILGWTVSGTNRNCPWDKRGPSLGQIGIRPWENTAVSSVEFHSKIGVLSRLSLGRMGVRPWDDCPARAVRNMFICYLSIVFFRPHFPERAA